MRAITRIVSAAAAAALAVTLTACSSSDDAAPGDTATGEPSASQQAAGSGDKGSTGGLSAENFHEVLAAAVESGTSYRMSMSSSATGAASTVEAEVVISDAGPAMSMTTSDAGVDMEVVMVDDAYYMNLGEITQGKFVKIDLNDSSNPLGSSVGSLQDLMDPKNSLGVFEDSVTSVEKVGEEEVDGASTTHYVVTVDSSSVSAALSGVSPSAAPSVPAEFVYDFWVDADNRPVKMTSDIMGSYTEILYSDWNDPSISVEAPSADQVTDLDFSELMGLGSTEG